MRTELAPLPSQLVAPTPERPSVDSTGLIADLERRVKQLEWILSMMTVNNTDRRIIWNGAVKTADGYDYSNMQYQQQANLQNAALAQALANQHLGQKQSQFLATATNIVGARPGLGFTRGFSSTSGF